MSLQNRKLRLTHPDGTVTVYQDGTAADALATTRYDNAFRGGVYVNENAQHIRIEILSLRQAWDEAPEIQIAISGPGYFLTSNQGTTQLNPNTKVELFADAPDGLTASANSFFPWHLNEQTGQVRYFYGWTERVDHDIQQSKVTATAYGALRKADELTLVKSRSDGLNIPRISFGETDADGPRFQYSIKTRSASEVTPGPGIPQIPGGQTFAWTIRVGDALRYLEAEYGDELATMGITASSDVFDDDDLDDLTLDLPPTLLDNVGFTSGVRQILRHAPNVRLFHDPRSLQFRIIPFATGLTAGFAELTGANTGAVLPVDDPSPFSATPGTDGYFVRIQKATEPHRWHFATVASVGVSSITLTAAPQFSLALGDLVQVVAGNAMPTVGLDGTGYLLTTRPSVDTQDVYSAVRITSVSQVTNTAQAAWLSVAGAQGLTKGWDEAFEASWRAGDENRREDYGADGGGIAIHEFDTTTGTDPAVIRIALEESAFGQDVVSNEWNGASVWIFSANNTGTRYLSTPISFTIDTALVEADIGDGRRGLAITLDATVTEVLTAVGGTLLDETTGPAASKVADLIGISTKFTLPTTRANNGRQRVGRQWIFTDEAIDGDDGSPHNTTCRLTNITVSACTGDTRVQHSGTPNGGEPGDRQGSQYEQVSMSGLGQIQVYRLRSFETQKPAACPEAGACGGVGWVPPQSIQAEKEYTTTTVTEARYPDTGHAGIAHTTFGVTREKHIVFDEWLNAGVSGRLGFFQELARRVWEVVSRPRWTGSIELAGIQKHGSLLDLSVQMWLNNTLTPVGGGDLFATIWGVPTSVTLDFARDAVSVELDSRGPFQALADAVFEQFGSEKTKFNGLREVVYKNQQLLQCAANANRNPSVSGLCATQVYSQGRPIPGRIVLPEKDNQATGLGPTTMAGDTMGGSYGGTSGYQADRTVIRDVRGNAYQVMPTGGIIPGTASGNQFTAALSSPRLRPVNRIDDAQAAASAALEGFGLTPQYDQTYVSSEVTAVADDDMEPTTIVTVMHTGLTADAYVGGYLELVDFRDGRHRQRYDILSNTTSTVTIATLTDHPRVGTQAQIWPPRVPVPDVSDWPDGGLVTIDTSGNYAVIDASTGAIAAASEDAGVLTKDTGITLTLRGSHALESGHSATYSGMPGGSDSPVDALWNEGSTHMPNAMGQGFTAQYADQSYHSRRADSQNSLFGTLAMRRPSWHVNYDESSDVIVKIVYSLSTAPSSGNAVLLRLLYSSGAIEAGYGSLTTVNATIDLTGKSAKTYYEHTFTTGSGWTTEGGIARFLLDRQGTNAADVYTGDVRGHVVEIIAKRNA